MSIRTRLAAVFSVFAVLAGITVLTMAAPANASVATITVTSAADTSGTCPSASNCTLRQALSDASSGGVNGGDDINITITPGLGTIALQLAPLGYNGGNGGAHTLTINGNGATVDGTGSFALFQSQSTGAVAMSGLNFRDGSSTSDGGAVSAAAALSLHDATFSNNYSAANGGAVFGSTTIELRNVTFEDNTSAVAGGAVYSSLDTNISFATFTDNSAAVGGAVCASGTLTVADSSFTRNAATIYGGAAVVLGQILASRSLFDDNSAQNNGGAVVASTGTFSQTEFSINTVFSGSGRGGAIYLTGSPGFSSVEDSVFYANSGPRDGGAIFSQNALTISRSSFDLNSAFNGAGGGVYSNDVVTVTDVSFTRNLADVAGALTGTTLTIAESDFSNNEAQIEIGAVAGDLVTISSSSFEENVAAQGVGAVMSNTNLTATQSSFTNNSAGVLFSVAEVGGTATLTNSTFANNSATGMMISASGGLEMSYSTVTGNSVTGNQMSPLLSSNGVISLFGNLLKDESLNSELCSGTAASSGYNFANDTSCGLSNTGDTENVSNDPMLGALGEHGSETLTQLPLVGSPLIGAIPNSTCRTGGAPAIDQRGFARPNVAGGPCDIGAVQLTPALGATVDNFVVTVAISEFTSTASVILQSDPITLGTIAVDGAGSGSGTFTIPCPIPGGTHTVIASGTGGQTASMVVNLVGCAPEVVPVFTG